MARKTNLDAVYAAIHELRMSGDAVNPTTVANKSGLRRSTFYQPNKDWEAVLEMIEGKRPVPLPSVVVPKIAPSTSRRYSKLASRVAEIEKLVADLNELSNYTHKQLLAQLLKYVSISKTSPIQRDEMSKLRRELSLYEQQYRELKIENIALVGKSQNHKVVPMKGLKRVLVVPNSVLEDQLLEFLSGLIERAFENRDHFKNISKAVLVCGLPQSGKSTWVAAQNASGTGITLFIEGSFHTAALRASAVNELRRRGITEVCCSWVLTAAEVCLERAFLADDEDAVPDLIDRMADELEAVTVHEGFDSIAGVRCG